MVIEDLVNKILDENLKKCMTRGILFRVDVSGEKIWETYLQGFSKENDPVFRDPNSSEHNCNCCHNFFHHFGNIVGLDENLEIVTLFDGSEFPDEYKKSFADCARLVREGKVINYFIETFDNLNQLPYEKGIKVSNSTFRLGFKENIKIYTTEEAEKFGVVEAGKTYTFRHFHINIPGNFVKNTRASKESILSDLRASKEVFKRAMDEIPTDTLELVRDLINQGSLLDGDAHLDKVLSMIPLSKEYSELPRDKKDEWCWIKAYGFKYARFKNELIGNLCSNLAQGKELNDACKEWNIRVDPANYMKATAPITKKQIEEAKKFVIENGYEESFIRRCATLEDIKVSDILHSNVGDGKINPVSIFDSIKPTATRHKKSEFSGVEEVSIEKFMKDILPTCTCVEAFVESRHKRNFVTLTTAENKDSKRIFKWDNNFSWTYNGNLAGKSQIKEAVKAAGGFVDAPFRFSIMWNENWKTKPVSTDLDAHAVEPTGGSHIYYSTEFRKDRGDRKTVCSGQLDIDMICPKETGVENIYWTDLDKLRDGAYQLYVNHYSGNRTTFKAEIAFGDQVYQYHYTKPSAGNMPIATVYIKNHSIDHIEHSEWLVNSEGVSENIWGVDTCEFRKVNLVCLSPNYWDKEIGNKHYFFMLEGCKNSSPKIRSFHNENLCSDLLKHRKVLEVLGNECMVDSSDNQLSGLGFDATVRDHIILKLKGTHNRVVKVNI